MRRLYLPLFASGMVSLSSVTRLIRWTVPTALAVSAVLTAPAEAAPRYYLRLRGVEMAPGAMTGGSATAASPASPTSEPPAAAVDGGTSAAAGGETRSPAQMVTSLANENLLAELRKRPEVVLEIDGVPADAPAPRYAEELKRRGLRGYEVTLRVLKVGRAIIPPPAGRRFRMLEESVKLSLVGTVYPGDPQLALGGDGESAVQIEVGVQISENQEREALSDAIKDAVSQAVSAALRKLAMGSAKPPKDPPRRKPAAKPAAK